MQDDSGIRLVLFSVNGSLKFRIWNSIFSEWLHWKYR